MHQQTPEQEVNTSSDNPEEIQGYVHAIESLGAVDGPGMRTVIFLEGCPLRCQFCHNIDCTIRNPAHVYTAAEVVTKALRNRPYWFKFVDGQQHVNGGITISGGEPTNQPEYLLALMKSFKENGVHTAIDSCLLTSYDVIDSLLPHIDLWMCSLKHMDDVLHKQITGVGNEVILDNFRYLNTALDNKPDSRFRVRFLIIPELTGTEDNIRKSAEFIKTLHNVTEVELLRYGTHGSYKWKELYGAYPLEGIREGTNEDLDFAQGILTEYGIPTIR